MTDPCPSLLIPDLTPQPLFALLLVALFALLLVGAWMLRCSAWNVDDFVLALLLMISGRRDVVM